MRISISTENMGCLLYGRFLILIEGLVASTKLQVEVKKLFLFLSTLIISFFFLKRPPPRRPFPPPSPLFPSNSSVGLESSLRWATSPVEAYVHVAKKKLKGATGLSVYVRYNQAAATEDRTYSIGRGDGRKGGREVISQVHHTRVGGRSGRRAGRGAVKCIIPQGGREGERKAGE